jgi:outer membrane protein assembly factor BamB
VDGSDSSPVALTRRQLVFAGGSALGAVVLARAGSADAALGALRGSRLVNSYGTVRAATALTTHSQSGLRIPGLAVDVHKGGTAPGLIFFAPFGPSGGQYGAVISEDSGEVVWEHPLAGGEIYNFKVQTYQGRPAVTWWQGEIVNGHGVGSYVIADDSYRPITQVRAGNGLHADLHEFLLTPQGTALITAYVPTHADMSAVGGSKHGAITDAVFQEVDIATGRVLLQWSSLDHIPLAESYWPVGRMSWDYVHLNSIDVDEDGQLLVSSRNTHTVYKIDRRSGEIIWRLGGKHSDFAMGDGVAFAWQHDVRRQQDGTLTVFDNQGAPHGGPQSRAIVLAVDEGRRTARLERQLLHPLALQSSSMGSVQVLPNGNLFVGWGAEPFVSEFSPSGELLFDARLGTDYLSYRAFRLPWTAAGEDHPAIAASRDNAGGVDLWASWNGDTQVTRWLVLGGGQRGALSSLGSFARSGFETAIHVDATPQRLAVRGLDASGHTLGESATLAPGAL